MNRTKIILKATIISIFVFLLQGVLTLIRTRVFIGFYGTDINGTMELSHQIFSYLVLLESGLGAAYMFKMYAPMAQKEYNKVNELYKGLTISLKKISFIMLIVLVIIATLYPMIMNRNTLSYFKVVFIILLLGIRFIIPYYFTLNKKNLLYVYEKKYIANFIDGITASLILILEIVLAKYLKVDIIITLFVGIIVTILVNYIYIYFIKKECREVLEYDEQPNFEAKKMTRDILVHQISSVAFNATDNILLSILSTLNNVTIYSAYNTVLTYPVTLINKIIDNLRATFGKKIVEDEKQAISIFYQTISLNYLIVAITAPLFYLCINDFVKLWIGDKFLVNDFCVFLWTLLYIHRCIIPTIYIARDGKGLYKESKNYTLTQAIANVVISIILIKPLGISGLLVGTVISTYFILIPANYNLVCKKVLQTRNNLIINLFLVIAYTGTMVFICNLINNTFMNFETLTWTNFIIKTSINAVLVSILSVGIMYLTNKNFRNLIKRFINITKIKNVFNKKYTVFKKDINK